MARASIFSCVLPLEVPHLPLMSLTVSSLGQRHAAPVVRATLHLLIYEVLTRLCPRFYSYANSDCNAPMVLAVNPPNTGQTSASFQEAAKTATISRSTSPSPSSSSSSEPSKTSTGSGSGATGGGSGAVNNGINCVLAFGAFFLALM